MLATKYNCQGITLERVLISTAELNFTWTVPKQFQGIGFDIQKKKITRRCAFKIHHDLLFAAWEDIHSDLSGDCSS